MKGIWKKGISIICIGGMAFSFTGCQTMKDNARVFGGALAGAAIGAAGGAAIAGSDNRGAGVLIGAIAGAAAGAAAGYAWQEKIKDKRSESTAVADAAQYPSYQPVQMDSGNAPQQPSAPELKILGKDFAPASGQIINGNELKATVVFRAVRRTSVNSNLCRADELQYKAPDGKGYAVVKKFDVDNSLPVGNAMANTSIVPFPADAPDGQYKLVSKVYDPADPSLADSAEFAFSVSNTGTVSLPSQAPGM